MNNSQIKVVFETITPLYTGDAWRENTNIRPSSLLGSLRFWFETICFFSGIVDETDYKDGILKDNFDYDIYKKGIINNGCGFDSLNDLFNEMKLPLPERIFGTTGFKSRIRIAEIEFNNKNFSNDLKGNKIIEGKNWYWKSPLYQGEITITFEIEKDIVKPIFYPLLNFMDQYGLWGGGWNIGYGRLKIKEVNEKPTILEKDTFEFSKFNNNNSYSDKNISDIVTVIDKRNDKQNNNLSEILLKYFLGFGYNKSENSNFSHKELPKNIPKNIVIIKIESNKDEKELIKRLIQKKAAMRAEFKKLNNNKELSKSNDKLRHSLFGELKEGSKILPWINQEVNEKEEKEYVGGLMSIGGLIRLKKEEKE